MKLIGKIFVHCKTGIAISAEAGIQKIGFAQHWSSPGVMEWQNIRIFIRPRSSRYDVRRLRYGARNKKMNFNYEKQKLLDGYSFVIGCDEVGRGCLAGPVVAAAVALRPFAESDELKVESYKVIKSAGIKDSKLLTSQKREELSDVIKKYFLWSIAEVSPEEVDSINIHNASLLAMRKAVGGLLISVIPESRTKYYSSAISGIQPQDYGSRLGGRDDKLKTFIFIDGKFPIPDLNLDQEAVTGGDNKVISIAAASIIAKVYRDDLMRKFDKQFPNYEFAKHKGYATEYHRNMVLQYGLSPIHRLSFCKSLA